MARSKKEEVESKVESSKAVLADILSDTSEDHFNDIIPENKIISSGSLQLDSVAKFRSGSVIRLCGSGAELGKTSQAFVFADNFMQTFPKSKTLFIKAEARLTPEMQERTGLKFVSKAEEWEYGTVFVWSINIFETIASSLEKLIPSMWEAGERLVIIWDSLDGTILKNDTEKDVWGKETTKVAGVPLLTKLLFKRLGHAIAHFDVLLMITSQYSAAIKIDPYAKDVPRQVEGSGGSAIGHQSDYVLYYTPRYNGDYILEKPDEKPDMQKNKVLGVYATIEFRKSSTDVTGLKVRVPIKKGRKGSAIWVEKEIVDMILAFGILNRKGAWCTFSPEIVAEAAKDGVTLQEQHQGVNNVFTYLESNKEQYNWLFRKIKQLIS